MWERKKAEFVRTSNRRDYALKPFSRTALNALKDEGFDVISVGKINDIFCGEGITKAYHSESSVAWNAADRGCMQRRFSWTLFYQSGRL